jgi:putative endonuclease
MKNYFTYILASKNKVLYVGMTNDLARRVFEHKEGLIDGFTKKYNVDRLVYYEVHPASESAVKRERQLKNWHRQWKINLIEEKNKQWKDLYEDISDPYKILYSINKEMLKQVQHEEE